MISKFFFSNKNSFDLIQDPIKNNWGTYWYLHNQSYEPYCWNIEVFSYEEIERIKVIIKIFYMIKDLTWECRNK